jgi:hypothetical protein
MHVPLAFGVTGVTKKSVRRSHDSAFAPGVDGVQQAVGHVHRYLGYHLSSEVLLDTLLR